VARVWAALSSSILCDSSLDHHWISDRGFEGKSWLPSTSDYQAQQIVVSANSTALPSTLRSLLRPRFFWGGKPLAQKGVIMSGRKGGMDVVRFDILVSIVRH
jgi:hypothetical protein